MAVTITQFGRTNLGKDIKLYTMKNKNQMEAAVTNIGACLVKLIVPNDKGEYKDIILGYDGGEEYLVNSCFFGATVGRCANRTAKAAFTIDGTTYNLAVNDNDNNLHSDFYKGMHKVLWDAKTTDDSVIFSYHSPDGENGFPGNLDMRVTYTLTDDNEIKIAYDGVSDKKTLINMTNHTYFNLSGHDHDTIEDTLLYINASNYTPVVAGAIPTGEIAPVKGTVMDFTQEKPVGRDIRADFEQLLLVKGYDHNYVVDGYNGSSKLIAVARADGRVMEVYSDLPGVQFYAGNCISPQEGKGGVIYRERTGFCLETQYFPNSANDPAFAHPIFDKGQKYETVTTYRFC
ncbi:MAG: galactose mutarotase [Lachnospiraceae bacterium]|nr:galactose mutarotase [Lachnospiraceae bacterium]MBR2530954.1 galactose mutarotase [Lachnospiraceae bacterium]